MAAGLGFKDFVTGEVLTAADVDGYLMQGIWVFATATARDAAVTSPQEGNFAFTKDNNSLWYYDGAAWVASGATGDIEGVTAGIGISGGGTSGTVTITNSMATAIDAKGDLVAGTGADTFAKLTVGANDTVLTADSTTATGLKWAAAASGSTFSGASVYGTVNQNISNASQTAVTFNTENYDTNTYHDNSTNNSRLTIPSGKTGYYRLTGMCRWEANNSGRRIIYLIKNGSTYVGQTENNPNGTNIELTNYISQTLYLTAGDYITLEVYQSCGGAIDVQKSSTVGTFFQIDYLGA